MKRKIFSHPFFVILLVSMLLNPFGFAKSPDKKNLIVSEPYSTDNYNLYSKWNLVEFGLSFNVFDYAIEGFSKAGFGGMTIAFLDYAKELPYFAQEVLPRLEKKGVRLPK